MHACKIVITLHSKSNTWDDIKVLLQFHFQVLLYMIIVSILLLILQEERGWILTCSSIFSAILYDHNTIEKF